MHDLDTANILQNYAWQSERYADLFPACWKMICTPTHLKSKKPLDLSLSFSDLHEDLSFLNTWALTNLGQNGLPFKNKLWQFQMLFSKRYSTKRWAFKSSPYHQNINNGWWKSRNYELIDCILVTRNNFSDLLSI